MIQKSRITLKNPYSYPFKILGGTQRVIFDVRALTKFQVLMSIYSKITAVMHGADIAGLLDHLVCTSL